MTTIYFDLETGGIEPRHPSIQLAAIAVDDATGKELEAFERKLRFDEAAADPEALKMNHYDAEVWKRTAVEPALAASDFARWVKPHSCIEMVSKRTGASYSVAKLSGYNALTFDLPRLRALFGTQFFPCSYHVRDVLQRAMFWFDEHPDVKKPENLKLGTVCTYFGIPIDGAHEALADVRATAALAQKLREVAP